MALPPLRQVITADTSQFDRALGSATSRLRRFAGPAAVGAAITALTALTRASMRSIDELAKIARPLGIATDRFQAMAMVAEEAGVSQNSLANAIGRMQRVLVDATDGSASAARALDRLGVNIDQIRRLSPDEQFRRIAESLSGIEEPTERAAAAMEVFGRSGREMINMLDDYGGALDEATEFQRRFGIAVSDEQAAAIERANDSLGRLGMAFRGLGNTLAVAAAPAVERFSNQIIGLAGAIADRVTPPHEDFLVQLALGPGLVADYEATLPGLADGIENAGSVANEAAERIERMNAALEAIPPEIRDQFARGGAAAMPGYSVPFSDESDLIRQFLRDPEAFSPTQAGVVVRDVRPGTIRPRQRPIDWTPEDAISAGLPGAAGVSDMLAERLEALVRGLQTEQEMVDDWYAEGLRVLTEAREQGLLTEEEFMAQRERLEEEHQQRLAAIRQAAEAQAMHDQNAFWNNLTAAAKHGGERMVRVVQALSAARALINAWTAYTEVLADPSFIGRPWARLAAAANVLGAGLQAVSAIRGVSAGGDGAGGGGAGGGGAASIPVQRMIIETQGEGMIGQGSIASIIDMINEAGRRGYRIEAEFVGRA